MPSAGDRRQRLYPTTRDGQPLLTNWTRNRSLDSFADAEES